MSKTRSFFVLALLALGGPLRADVHVTPTPTPFVPRGAPPLGGGAVPVALPDPCADPLSQPTITLTLEPPVIYPDDLVTLRWEVRNRRHGLAWTSAVHVRGTFRVDPILSDPTPASGSRSWTARRSIRHGTFTLETFCGRKSLEYAAEYEPRIDQLTPNRGGFMQSVAIWGDHFGPPQGASEVRLSIAGQNIRLPVASWTNRRIDVTLPPVPAGDGSIRVYKAGRLESLAASFHSLGGREIPGFPKISPPQLPTPLTIPTPFQPRLPASFSISTPTPTATPHARR